MDLIFLTEQANQRVRDDAKTVLNKRIDYLLNPVEHGLFLKDNYHRPTAELVLYFPHAAIQAMSAKEVIKKWVYLILYTQDPGSKLDRYEEPYIWNDHDFDVSKGLNKKEIAFHRMYKKLKIYQLYSFDSDSDAKAFFRRFLAGVNCSEDTFFMFAKRRVEKFNNYQAYMRDRDRGEDSDDHDDPAEDDADLDSENDLVTGEPDDYPELAQDDGDNEFASFDDDDELLQE